MSSSRNGDVACRGAPAVYGLTGVVEVLVGLPTGLKLGAVMYAPLGEAAWSSPASTTAFAITGEDGRALSFAAGPTLAPA